MRLISTAVKYFNREIEEIAKEIEPLKISLIKLAKEQNLEEMEKVSKDFFDKNPKIHQRMLELYFDYISESWPVIFGDELDMIHIVYDNQKIKGIDLICIGALSEEMFSIEDIFCYREILKKALRNEGYPQIADYIQRDSINTLATLKEAFKKTIVTE